MRAGGEDGDLKGGVNEMICIMMTARELKEKLDAGKLPVRKVKS